MRMEDEKGGGVSLLSLSLVLGCFFFPSGQDLFCVCRDGQKERGRGGQEREGGGRRESGEAGMIREEREIKWLTGDGG